LSHRIPITIRIDSFEGPLDLLLYLIQSHELDISKVSIARITDQYLLYVTLMQELNFDTASEFLVMAATLLHWKSKSLLPQDEQKKGASAGAEDEVFTQEDLIRQLLEHQRFLKAGETLAELPLLGESVFARHNAKPPIEKIWKDMDLSDLALAFQDIWARARKRTHVLKKETVSISDKIAQFAEQLPLHELTEFRTLLSSFSPSRSEIVATFLAVLELSRLKKMTLHQEATYASIYVELLESLLGLDSQLVAQLDSEFQSALSVHPAAL